MANSSSSGSSFTSSSLGRPPSYGGQTYASPFDSTWTPNSAVSSSSAVSALTSEASAPQTNLRPLDLGPPGYQATIILFENTPNERTVYLGPWEVVGSENRRILWQCSYQSELLEHFLPSDVPADIFPHTLHARHRPYTDACELELFVSFREPHHIRYTTGEGVIIHDQPIEVKYEFTTVEGSVRFQGDVRRKDLLDYFDVDVVWSDAHSRTDSFGSVRGMGLIQRLKLWQDRYTTFHSITVYANRSDRQYKEYEIHNFEGELRGRDDRQRQVRLNVRGRRSSADSHQSRRMSFSRIRPRQRSVGNTASPSSSGTEPVQPSPLNIRYLGIQFSTRDHYRRFLERWVVAHSSDSEFNGVPFPTHRFELPSPQIMSGELQPVLEPPEADEDPTP